MTGDIEQEAEQLIARIEDLGGAVAAIEQGFQKTEIERSAYQIARQIDAQERVVVGVNRFVVAEEEPYQPLRVDPAIERDQAERLGALRSARDQAEFTRRISDLRRAADGADNLLYPLREALRARATVGEVCDALRDVWGVYKPPDVY
jgi:methylmalonyl-CoA mutase N-terminal domain/subunit